MDWGSSIAPVRLLKNYIPDTPGGWTGAMLDTKRYVVWGCAGSRYIPIAGMRLRVHHGAYLARDEAAM